MSKSQVATINLQLDTTEVEISLGEVFKALSELQSVVKDTYSQMSGAFSSALDTIEVFKISADELCESVKSIGEWDFSRVLTELRDISDALDGILEKLKETDWVEIASLAQGAFSQGFDIFSYETTRSKGKYESRKMTGFGGYKGKYTTNQETDSLGVIAGGMGLMDGSLSNAFSDIAAKLKDSAAATWLQNAAATAWQGISTAATAVTTAFGAAMNFLTSPIGLVVIGITALIAIIVLLIANWDTVSAAVVNFMDILRNGLEKFDAFVQGIFDIDWTQYLGPLGNVLNAFFANVENIWNAIKSIFSGIISFVKNVFAGDWGAAWNSIVDVFKGIGDYLAAIVFLKSCSGNKISESR